MQKTLTADEARTNWRDMLDTALRGGEMVIERYNKPIAVVVNYEEWQARFTKREVEAIVAARLADLRNEPTIAHDDLVKMIMERRAGNVAN